MTRYQITVGGRRGAKPLRGARTHLCWDRGGGRLLGLPDRLERPVFLADQMDEIGYGKFREEIQKEFGPKEQAAEEW